MQLTCPSCNARYLVKPQSIGKEGRKVKCAKCAHIWKAEAPQEDTAAAEILEALNEELESQQEDTAAHKGSTNLPVPRGGKPAPAGLKAAAILLLCTALGMAFLAHAPEWRTLPGLSVAYELFDMQDSPGIRLEDVSVASMNKQGRVQFFVNGVIINTSEVDQPMPQLQIVLADMNGEPVRTEKFVKSTTLPAKESVPFSTEISSRSKDVTQIIVDVGSGFDIGRRE